MRRLLFISVGLAVALAGVPDAALAAQPSMPVHSAGRLSSIYLIGTLDPRDRPRVFARFDRKLPAAKGQLRGARVRLAVRADVVVAGTGVSEPVHTSLTRRLGSLRRSGSWRVELPLRRVQAERIERAARVPSQLRVNGTAVQTILPHGDRPLPSSRITGVAAAAPPQFEGQEKVNGSVSADYVIEEEKCEHSQHGCPASRAEGTWSNPTWREDEIEFENGEDPSHGDLAMTSCNGGWSGVCEGIAGGIFAAVEVNSISAYPEGTAFFNLSRAHDESTPEIEVAAEYNEHDHSEPPTGCRVVGYSYGIAHFLKGPEPTCFSQRTVEANGEEGEGEGDEGEGTAYDSYVVSTVWPAGSNPP